MYNVVSFSGGRTSAYMVHLIEQMRKRDEIHDVHYVFMDTGAEHPKTYEFIRKCVEHFEIDLICLRTVISDELGVGPMYRVVGLHECKPDLEPWVDINRKHGTPFTIAPKCTDRMKTVPFQKYCNEMFGRNNYMTWLGLRADEPRRLKEREDFAYLAHISNITKPEILDWWSDMPFDLEIDEHLGNCVFCIKKAEQKIALAMRDEPEMARQFDEMLNREDVRTLDTRTIANDAIYRNGRTMADIAEMFEHVPTDFLRQRMKPNRGNCQESCEVFGCQDDLFAEE